LTGKRHQDVIRDIRNVLDQAEIEAAQFCAPCKLPSGQTAQTYLLPRRECDLVISNIGRLVAPIPALIRDPDASLTSRLMR